MKIISEKYSAGFIYLALTIITFAVYWQVHSFAFTDYYDDDIYVSKNEHISSGLVLSNVVWIFTHPYGGHWHPLTGLSHMLDCQLFGLNAGWHHLVNLLLHIANTLLLFAVFKRATGALWRSAFVAILFAVHPLHVESVAWISDRKDLLSTFLWILTIAVSFRYVKNRRIGWYALAICLFTLGIMAKSMLVTLPFVLLLLDYWPLNRLEPKWACCRRLVLEKIPFFAVSAVSSIVTFFVFKGGGQVRSIEAIPVISRACNAIVSYIKYTEKMIWPAHLAVVYPYSENIVPVWLVLVEAVILLLITICAIRFGAKYKYLPVGWLWYLGTLIPVIGLVQVGDHAMADRYTYVPLIGLFIIIAWGATDLLAGYRYRKIFLSVSSLTVVLVLSVCTFFQTSYWRNSQVLFEHALKAASGEYLLYNNLSVIYGNLGRYEDAIEACKKAIKMKPYSPEAYCNLGVVYGKLGRYNDEIEAYEQAIKVNPDYADAYYNLGVTYGKLGRYTDEIKAYEQTIRVEPDYAGAHYYLGIAYSNLGRYKEATEAFKQAIRLKPDDAKAYYNLGAAYGNLGRHEDAIKAFKQAIRIKPDYAEAYYNLGAAYGNLGRYEDAIKAFKQAISIKPDYAEAYYNLGVTYLSSGDKTAAIEQYKILETLNTEVAARFSHVLYNK